MNISGSNFHNVTLLKHTPVMELPGAHHKGQMYQILTIEMDGAMHEITLFFAPKFDAPEAPSGT